MKYVNANDVLPKELIKELQKYVQGSYIYVPKADGSVREKNPRTEYKIELKKRNEHIYLKYLQRWTNIEIAKMYHLSESSIRRVIFAQKNKAKEVKKMIQKVLPFWDINAEEELRQCHNHVWEIDSMYMIKVYEDEETLQRNLKILKALLKYDVPVSEILETKEGKDYIEFCGKYYMITRKLSGEHIKDARKDGVAYQMGCAIGHLHHRDVHSGNFLFENTEFSGYIDFDLSQKNIRIFDLCYFLAGLLTEENGVLMKAEEWLEICKKVVKGYESKTVLSDQEKQSMSYVMESIELLFAAYFINVEDIRCALDAIKVYRYIHTLEEKIYRTVQ